MFSLCTLTLQPCSIGVLILCKLPEVSLSQWCINICYTKLDTKQRTKTKLATRSMLVKNQKLTVGKIKTVQ